VRRVLVLAACGLVACSSGGSGPPFQGWKTGRPDCPGVPGVVPDDGRDDTAALQRAIDTLPDAGGDLCLGPGAYDFARPAGNAHAYRTIDIRARSRITLRGVGRETRLRMVGDGRDLMWTLLNVRAGSTDVTISDLALEGGDRVNTVEQTHLLQIEASRGTTVTRVTFDLPDHHVAEGKLAGGDCIRLLGEDGAEVRDVIVRDNTAVRCERSFVSVQRGVVGVVIEDNQTHEVGGQAIDFEPSGAGEVRDFTIRRNQLARGPHGRGAYTVAISGGRFQYARAIELADNVVADGGLMIMDAEQVAVTRNTVTGSAFARPVLFVIRHVADVAFTGNTFTRIRESGRGPVVMMRHHNDLAPRDIRFDGDAIVQHADGAIMRVESVDGLEVHAVTMRYAGATPDRFYALDARGVVRGLDRIKMVGGSVHGALRGVARISQFKEVANGSIEIDAVTAEGPTTDVALDRGRPNSMKVLINRGRAVPPNGVHPRGN
jgi:hypothetical protein